MTGKRDQSEELTYIEHFLDALPKYMWRFTYTPCPKTTWASYLHSTEEETKAQII